MFPRPRDPNDRNLESAQGSLSPREVLPRNEFSYESMVHTSVALDLEAIKQYNQALNFSDMKSRAEALGLVETNLRRAVDLSSQAVEFLKASPRPTSAQKSASYYSNTLLALAARAQSMSLFVRTVDRSQRAEARAAFFNYIIAEPDAAKKLHAKHLFAQTLFEAEAFEEARVEYERLAAEDPNDSEAKGNLGLVLFELGRRKESEGKTSEARNYFVRAAHYLSESANEPKMGGPLNARIAEVLKILADKTAAQTVAAP